VGVQVVYPASMSLKVQDAVSQANVHCLTNKKSTASRGEAPEFPTAVFLT
jgi:hypothetical protein